MRKLWLILSFVFLLFPATAFANPDAVNGRWKLIAFKDGTKRKAFPAGTTVVLLFDKAEWKWTAVITHEGKQHRASGSWTMNRNVITMDHKGRKSDLVASSSAGTLTLGLKENPAKRFVAIRAAAPK